MKKYPGEKKNIGFGSRDSIIEKIPKPSLTSTDMSTIKKALREIYDSVSTLSITRLTIESELRIKLLDRKIIQTKNRIWQNPLSIIAGVAFVFIPLLVGNIELDILFGLLALSVLFCLLSTELFSISIEYFPSNDLTYRQLFEADEFEFSRIMKGLYFDLYARVTYDVALGALIAGLILFFRIQGSKYGLWSTIIFLIMELVLMVYFTYHLFTSYSGDKTSEELDKARNKLEVRYKEILDKLEGLKKLKGDKTTREKIKDIEGRIDENMKKISREIDKYKEKTRKLEKFGKIGTLFYILTFITVLVLIYASFIVVL